MGPTCASCDPVDRHARKTAVCCSERWIVSWALWILPSGIKTREDSAHWLWSHRVYKDSSQTFVGLKMTKICWISVFWSHCCMNGVIPSVPSSIKQLCRFSDRKSVRPLLPPAADEQLTVSWLTEPFRFVLLLLGGGLTPTGSYLLFTYPVNTYCVFRVYFLHCAM